MKNKKYLTVALAWTLFFLVTVNVILFAFKMHEVLTKSPASCIEDSSQLKEICERAKAADNAVLIAVKPGERLAYNPETRQVFWVGDAKQNEKEKQ